MMIRDILLLQKRELEKRGTEKFVERDIDFNRFLANDLVKVIIGPRRAGKSFLGFNILGKTGNFGYANFDDEKLIETKNYDEIISTLNGLYSNPKYLFFDEIQNLSRWELFINRLQRQGFNLVITGSNSNLLSSELSPHLTGRHLLVNIFPFSFAEFLRLEGDYTQLTSGEIKNRLFEYLTYGGYPEPLIKKIDHKEYLSTLFNSIIYKDIVRRFNIRLIPTIENLAAYLVSNTAREFSYNTLSRIIKCKSVHTVEKYLNYLEESFIFFRVHRFSFKLQEQISSNKKIYCIDNGFIHAKAFRTESNAGQLYENAVAVKLKKSELDGGAKVYYWKHPLRQEVDFVLKEGTEVTRLIQVCHNLNDIKAREQEEKSLIKASQELNCGSLLIINEDYEGEEEKQWFGAKRKIQYLPLWKYLAHSQ
ncbi:MAG: ATP-binding protein [Candidatus Omnitrophica bacterium]|nr:ATP-binding protein [Candidatus Omnitrophota bacterium]